MSDDISDGHSTSSSSTGNRPQCHNFQLDSAKTSMMLMVFSVKFDTALNLKVWHPALCSGSTVTSVVCGCTIVSTKKNYVSHKYVCRDCSATSH